MECFFALGSLLRAIGSGQSSSAPLPDTAVRREPAGGRQSQIGSSSTKPNRFAPGDRIFCIAGRAAPLTGGNAVNETFATNHSDLCIPVGNVGLPVGAQPAATLKGTPTVPLPSPKRNLAARKQLLKRLLPCRRRRQFALQLRRGHPFYRTLKSEGDRCDGKRGGYGFSNDGGKDWYPPESVNLKSSTGVNNSNCSIHQVGSEAPFGCPSSSRSKAALSAANGPSGVAWKWFADDCCRVRRQNFSDQLRTLSVSQFESKVCTQARISCAHFAATSNGHTLGNAQPAKTAPPRAPGR
uniref:Uncharacterized protein n=1 Tax=Trichuris muris TaxID=70415 RepID=A0A5S6R391_TRIMR